MRSLDLFPLALFWLEKSVMFENLSSVILCDDIDTMRDKFEKNNNMLTLNVINNKYIKFSPFSVDALILEKSFF